MAETYPSTADYITAIRRMDAFVLDPVLKTGIPRCIDGVSVDRGGEPLLYSGGFAKVFVIDKAGKTYAFRCWTMDIGSTAQHYDAVGDYLRGLRSTYFADFEFLPEGILVKGKRYPTLRMEWIEAGSLRDFLGAHVGQREVLTAAAESFQQMTRFLQDQRIAHGDLQSDNIKMQRLGARVRFHLIDYDTLFVPALDGTRVTNVGLPSYQHPSRHVSEYISPKDDYFSSLVIYLTLHALAEDPLLWRDYKIENRDKAGLLFGAEDFRSGTPSELFQRLRRLSPFVSNLALALWNFSRCPSIELLIPLHSVMEVCRASPAGGAGNFDALLRNKMPQRGGNGWLQEWTPPVATVHLAKRPSRAAAPPVIAPVPSQPTSFDLLLQKGRYAAQPTSPSATPPIQPSQGAPPPSATTGNWKVLFWVIVVIIIILCLLMISCAGHDGITAKDVSPFSEGLVGSDNDGVVFLVSVADDLEEHGSAGRVEAEVADFIDNEQLWLSKHFHGMREPV